MPILTPTTWAEIRRQRAEGATFGELSRTHGVTRQAISKRAIAENRATADAPRADAPEQGTATANHLALTHRAEWLRHRTAFPPDISDPKALQAAKDMAEMILARQLGERLAWGMDRPDGEAVLGPDPSAQAAEGATLEAGAWSGSTSPPNAAPETAEGATSAGSSAPAEDLGHENPATANPTALVSADAPPETGSPPPFTANPTPPTSATPNPAQPSDFMRRILHAAGYDPGGPIPAYWSLPESETYIRETFIVGLRLTEAKCISVAATASRHFGAPVRSPQALRARMRYFA